MPIFSKLFEILPDAEHLLSLEPEELAGPLLVSLESKQIIIPEDMIALDSMLRDIQRNPSLSLKYPNECYNAVLFALMEAWQWLENEGFVAPRPTQLEGSTTMYGTTPYFVTRRGQRIETLEDFKVYRKANLLPKHQLHAIIAEKVWSIFSQGSYGTAVLEAFKQVEIAVRKAGGYADTDYGTDLMSKAFHVDNGNLTDQNQQGAEKKARFFLFAGAIGSYKNPSSHRDIEMTAEEAAEVIIFASHLLRIVDSCNPPETS